MEDPVTPGSEIPVVATATAGIEEIGDGAKPAVANKNGKKAESGSGGGSFFTWFIVLALLGVWTSVAVVYFDLVDYQGVLDKAKGIQINLSEALQGKLVAYDTDGDGDFDVEDAKILLDDEDGGASKTAAHRDNPRSKDSHLKLREALRHQLAVIQERVEAKKLARMALAEVRQLLAKEEEARALELGRANMSARVMERVAARLKLEEERMEREEMDRAMEKIKTEKVEEPKAPEKLEKEQEEGNQTSRAEGRVKTERRVEGKARDRPKKNRSEKS